MDDTEERPGATRISRDGQNFGKALLDIINDILHFSEIEASKLELEVIHFNLRDCVGTVLQPLALSRAEKKWLKLRTDIGGDVPQHLIGDSMRLRQILLNFTDNALKFIERGSVIAQVTAEAQRDGEQYLHFRLSTRGLASRPKSGI